MTPLLTPVTGPLFAAHLRDRFAPLPGRRLVTVTPDGGTAYWVRTAEQHDSFTVTLPHDTCGLGRAAEVSLVWRAHDPATVARRRIFDGHAHIRRYLDRRIADHIASVPGLVDAELEETLGRAFDGTLLLADVGLTCEHAHVALARQSMTEARQTEAEDLRWALEVERVKRELALEQLRFYRELIDGGTEALLAYWLRQRPGDIRDIIEYRETHPPQPSRAVVEARSNAALFADLPAYDRSRIAQFVAFGMAQTSDSTRALLRKLDVLAPPLSDPTAPIRPDDEPRWPPSVPAH